MKSQLKKKTHSYNVRRRYSSGRGKRGAHIAEFSVALFALIFCGLLPLCNLLSFASSLNAVQQLTLMCAREAAMADTRSMAIKSAMSIKTAVEDPTLCALHNVHARNADCQIVAVDDVGTRSFYKISQASRFAPGLRINKHNRYSLQLMVQYEIEPLINLTGVPVVGQIPMIGCAAPVHFQPEVPIENLRILED